jgi:hypothetical protein
VTAPVSPSCWTDAIQAADADAVLGSAAVAEAALAR